MTHTFFSNINDSSNHLTHQCHHLPIGFNSSTMLLTIIPFLKKPTLDPSLASNQSSLFFKILECTVYNQQNPINLSQSNFQNLNPSLAWAHSIEWHILQTLPSYPHESWNLWDSVAMLWFLPGGSVILGDVENSHICTTQTLDEIIVIPSLIHCFFCFDLRMSARYLSMDGSSSAETKFQASRCSSQVIQPHVKILACPWTTIRLHYVTMCNLEIFPSYY